MTSSIVEATTKALLVAAISGVYNLDRMVVPERLPMAFAKDLMLAARTRQKK
jgi:hypothetical protein